MDKDIEVDLMEKSDELEKLKRIRPYFNYGHSEPPESKYVAWIDIMGSKSFMMRSTEMISIALGKLHTAALKAREMNQAQNMQMIPVIDGVYITAEHQHHITYLLYLILRSLALEFIFSTNNQNRFIVRGAITYGPVTDGVVLCKNEKNSTLINNHEYSSNILLGPAISQASESERFASPFGIWIHESARHFSPDYRSGRGKPLQHTHWHWWSYSTKPEIRQEDQLVVKRLKQSLGEYYDWCEENSSGILYSKDRILHHKELCSEYFSNVEIET